MTADGEEGLFANVEKLEEIEIEIAIGIGVIVVMCGERSIIEDTVVIEEDVI